MPRVTVREVQHNLAEILRRVEAGEPLAVHRRRKPVAWLTPPASAPAEDVDWGDLEEWRVRTWGRKGTPGTPVEQVVSQARDRR